MQIEEVRDMPRAKFSPKANSNSAWKEPPERAIKALERGDELVADERTAERHR
jgi:hypothetical protein